MMRCCGVSPIIWSSICPPMGRARKVCRWVFAVSTSGGWGFAERGCPPLDLARRNKAAGSETAAACNRCNAVLWSRAWRSEPCVDRLCLPFRG